VNALPSSSPELPQFAFTTACLNISVALFVSKSLSRFSYFPLVMAASKTVQVDATLISGVRFRCFFFRESGSVLNDPSVLRNGLRRSTKLLFSRLVSSRKSRSSAINLDRRMRPELLCSPSELISAASELLPRSEFVTHRSMHPSLPLGGNLNHLQSAPRPSRMYSMLRFRRQGK